MTAPLARNVGAPTGASTAGRELTGRNARSETTVHGWPALVLGLPFAGVGGALVAYGLRWLAPAERAGDAPRWLATVAGVIFAWAGLSFVVHGVRGLGRRRRVRELVRRHPGQPWWSDHPWDPRGARDGTGAEMARALYMAVFMAVFLVPFHWIGFFAPDRVLGFGLVSLLFDLAILALLGRAAYLAARRAKFGRGAIAFARFPFRVGETVDAYLAPPRGLERAPEALAGTLRCVGERYEVRGTGEDRRSTVVCYELYAAPVTVTTVDDGAGGTALHVSAPIAPGAPATVLAERPPRYWELELRADAPGVDYAATFLVPVY